MINNQLVHCCAAALQGIITGMGHRVTGRLEKEADDITRVAEILGRRMMDRLSEKKTTSIDSDIPPIPPNYELRQKGETIKKGDLVLAVRSSTWANAVSADFGHAAGGAFFTAVLKPTPIPVPEPESD